MRYLAQDGGVGTAKAGLVNSIIAQLALAEGCSRVVTFDRAAVRDAGMTLVG